MRIIQTGCFLLFISLFNLNSNAQSVDLKHFNNLKPRAIGPAGMSGRVTSIDVVRNQPQIIYIGTASGGVWKSIDGGLQFKPIFDEAPVQSVGAIAINQQNPSEIWVGTGEGNPRNSHSSGEGIFKSIDGGRTFQYMGLKETKAIHRIIIDAHNPKVVYVAAMGSAWGPNEERGVFKTQDGGKTWKKILYAGAETGCGDLVVDPSNPNKLIAALWQFGRKPYFFESGGDSSSLRITYNGGETWQKLDERNGLPKGKIGRVGLAIAPSNPNVVYALVESKKTGLYRSNDGGHQWSLVTTNNIGNRPFYYADLFVDSKNPDKLWNLYSLVSLSIDGGKTFDVKMPYSGYHPDHHAFYIHPDNPDFIINGNDGGLNISTDGGNTWRYALNLPLGQFYHVNYDMDIPYNLYGGLQDNGSWVGPAYVWRNGGILNAYWEELVFGDGFDVVPIPNTKKGYAMYQGGNLYRYDLNPAPNIYIKPTHPKGETLRFNWNAGIAIDPFNNNGVYFGSQYLHYSDNQGDSWKIISPDLTTNDKEKQQQAKSGGLTTDATNAENYTTILAIAPSPLDQKTIWVGTDDGNIQLTQDGGETWLNTALNATFLPKNSWITQVVASSYQKDEAFVVVNNYRQNDWRPFLLHTTDAGKTWTNLANGQITGHCLAVVQDPKSANLIFLGTEYGLYVSVDKGKNWSQWKHHFPSVPTMDLKIHPREGDLIIGTFGRALYVLDDLEPLRQLANSSNKKYASNFQLFTPPTAYLVDFKSPKGLRFPADADFSGQNRPNGARLQVWIDEALISQKPDSTSTKTKSNLKADEMLVVIYNNQGDTIRHFKHKVDTGVNRIVWDLRTNGKPWPNYNLKADQDFPPAGYKCEPGTYAVSMYYKNMGDTQMISVEKVPGMDLVMAPNTFQLRINTAHEKLNKITLQLNESKNALAQITQLAKLSADSVQDSLEAKTKLLNKTIDSLYLPIMLAKDFEGYDHVTENMTTLLGKAYEYYDSGMGTAEDGLDNVLIELEKRIEHHKIKVNTFYESDWTAFVAYVDQLKLQPYKSYQPIK